MMGNPEGVAIQGLGGRLRGTGRPGSGHPRRTATIRPLEEGQPAPQEFDDTLLPRSRKLMSDADASLATVASTSSATPCAWLQTEQCTLNMSWVVQKYPDSYYAQVMSPVGVAASRHARCAEHALTFTAGSTAALPEGEVIACLADTASRCHVIMDAAGSPKCGSASGVLEKLPFLCEGSVERERASCQTYGRDECEVGHPECISTWDVWRRSFQATTERLASLAGNDSGIYRYGFCLHRAWVEDLDMAAVTYETLHHTVVSRQAEWLRVAQQAARNATEFGRLVGSCPLGDARRMQYLATQTCHAHTTALAAAPDAPGMAAAVEGCLMAGCSLAYTRGQNGQRIPHCSPMAAVDVQPQLVGSAAPAAQLARCLAYPARFNQATCMSVTVEAFGGDAATAA